MKQFIYKLIILMISVVLVYKLTIGEQLNTIIKKINSISTKENRKETIDKIRNEMKKAVQKQNYINKEDAELINMFINKIKSELKNAEN